MLTGSIDFCILSTRAQRHLYEVSAFSEAETMCATNLSILADLHPSPQVNDSKATTMSHQANILRANHRPREALEINLTCYRMRSSESSMKMNLLCFTAHNVAACFADIGDSVSALRWLDVSYEWWSKKLGHSVGEGDLPSFLVITRARCTPAADDPAET